ncbi:heparan-alpha-glucosaminide N-acetyltransferase [Desulforamulus putei]|uniref:heparan-alpha-glucosaminide N-acetyltransferase n=1 Tax=Desulforamulus putei TaxID=74701 RepID=UPI002FDDDC74
MTNRQSDSRIWELDLLRGTAILLMVLFHIIFDLNEFFQVPIPYAEGPVFYIGKAAASLFIFVAGISCSLSRNNVKRGVKLIGLGLLITLVTSLVVPGSNIIFGILHFLGTAVLLYDFFKRLRPGILLILGTAVIWAGSCFQQITMPNSLLAPLGLLGPDFYSVDYYPLVPWLGLFLYGVAVGKMIYKEKKSLFPAFPLRQNLINTLGRHSLSIYLLHQPVILLLLSLIYRSFPFKMNA